MPLNVVGNVHDWKAKIWRWTNDVENKNQEERDTDRTRLEVYFTIFDFIQQSFVCRQRLHDCGGAEIIG